MAIVRLNRCWLRCRKDGLAESFAIAHLNTIKRGKAVKGMACGCLNQDLQDFGNFGMGGAPLAQGRWYECLTRDHESLREIWGGGCLRVHGGQLAMAAVVGTGDNLTLKGQIGGHGGRLAVSAVAGAGGGVLAGGQWVGTYSRCAPAQKIFNILGTTLAVCPSLCPNIVLRSTS